MSEQALSNSGQGQRRFEWESAAGKRIGRERQKTKDVVEKEALME